jgi:hypothetical protein
MACAVLSARRIPASFNEVKRYTKEQRLRMLLNPIFTYFKMQWIDKEILQAYSVNKRQHRTDNSIVNFHRNLMRVLRSPSPWPYQLSFLLQRFSHIRMLLSVVTVTRNRKADYLLQDKTIKRATANLETAPVLGKYF